MRPAASSGLVVSALVLVLASCGGGDDGDAEGGVQEGDARKVVLSYFQAVVKGDSERACGTYLTKRAVRNVYGQESCKGVVDFVSGPVRVESVEAEGDTAQVVVFLSAGTKDRRFVTVREEGGTVKVDEVDRRAP